MSDGPHRSASSQMRALGIPPEVLGDFCEEVRERTMRALAHTAVTDDEKKSLADSVVLSVRQTIATAWLYGKAHGEKVAFDPEATPQRPLRRRPTQP